MPLSNNENLVRRGIHRVEMEGESNLAGLLEEVERQSLLGRVSNCFEQSAEIVALFGGDQDRRECSEAQRARTQLRRLGVLVIVFVAGSRNSRCMRAMSSSARYFYTLERPYRLGLVFYRLRGDSPNAMVQTLQIVERLADGGDLEPGSLLPAATWDVDAGTLTWQQNFVLRDGITVSYRTRPAGLGRVPVSGGLTLQWRDNQNRMGSATLNPPMVHVFGAPQSEP